MIDDSRTFSPHPKRAPLEDASATPAQAACPSAADAALAFTLSPAAQPFLDQLAQEPLDDAHVLALITHLRHILPAQVARELVSQARLRRRALAKFPDAGHMFFTAEALEQSTAHVPAAHRAAQLDSLAHAGDFLDLSCGIGGDLIALARRRPVIAYEIDPVRATMAMANVTACGLADRVTLHAADWTEHLASKVLPRATAAFVDPARRSDGRRTFDVHAMRPPLGEILKLRTHAPLLAVKVMPSVVACEVPPDCSIEFVSHQGTCKEAVLWFGRNDASRRWASVHRTDGWHTLADDGTVPPAGELSPGMILYEPDPAVIRAGALAPLCRRVGGHLLDPEIAYIVGPKWVDEPFTQAFAVDEVHRFSLRTLNRRLAALGIGRVELLKRGFPQEPESLRRRLRLLPGGRAGAVILTRHNHTHWMLIGRRLSTFDSSPTQC